MKRKRFSDEQIVVILRESEESGRTVTEVCREHGIAETTLYRWRRRFGGLSVPETRRLRDLEKENARLKRLLAERDLEIDAMKELTSRKW